jgi:hypothetical protein
MKCTRLAFESLEAEWRTENLHPRLRIDAVAIRYGWSGTHCGSPSISLKIMLSGSASVSSALCIILLVMPWCNSKPLWMVTIAVRKH